MIWKPHHARDSRVVESSSIILLENYTNLSARMGVYIFLDVNHHVKYVGKAGARRMVEEIANAIYRGKDRGATRVKALYTRTDANALSLETAIRQYYDPPNNLQ